MYLDFLKDFTVKALDVENNQKLRNQPIEISDDNDIQQEGQIQKV
jgi:hypothetical protein